MFELPIVDCNSLSASLHVDVQSQVEVTSEILPVHGMAHHLVPL